jgi:deoxyribonuclease-4
MDNATHTPVGLTRARNLFTATRRIGPDGTRLDERLGPYRMGPRLGAHMSVAGGLDRAVARAIVHRCDAFQIFAKNAYRWQSRALSAEDIRAFRDRLRASGIAPVVSHASYLINLAASGAALRTRSLDAMDDELDRAEALGLLGVVLHPGAHTHGSESGALLLVAAALSDLLHRRPNGRTMVLLEHTAGQGTSLGRTFGQIAAILAAAGNHHRLGVCLDTCHLFASGYDIRSRPGYEKTFAAFDRLVGFDRLKVFHLNDSKRPLGSRVDRHAHIGEGYIGLAAFRRLVNDPRFEQIPMLLETPKTAGPRPQVIAVDPLDAKNLDTLRRLVVAGTPAGRGR